MDGCDACQAVLRYALEEAGGAAAAWRSPWHTAGPAQQRGNTDAEGEDFSADAGATARRCLEQAAPAVPPGHAAFEITTEEMSPVDALAAAARNVVGCHHEEPAGGNTVGSPTNRLLEHSPVPVINVPRSYRPPHAGGP